MSSFAVSELEFYLQYPVVLTCRYNTTMDEMTTTTADKTAMTEYKIYEPLPNIVVPEQIKKEIRSAKQRYNAYSTQNKVVFLLERSGPIVFDAIAQYDPTSSRVVKISIGRDISQRYLLENPGKNTQITNDSIHGVSTATDGEIKEYLTWLGQDPTTHILIDELVTKIKKLDIDLGDQILCLDDVFQTGVTAISAAHILKTALSLTGKPCVVNFEGNKNIRRAISLDADMPLDTTHEVKMFSLLKNPNWLHEILDASFGSDTYLYADPGPQDIANARFLYEVIKGFTKDPNGIIRPLSNWREYERLGEMVLEMDVKSDIQAREDETLVNPATALGDEYGHEQIMMLPEKLKHALKQIS